MKKLTFCILLATMSWFATTNAYAKKNSGPTPEEKGLAQINQANAEAFVRFLAADELKSRKPEQKRKNSRKLHCFAITAMGCFSGIRQLFPTV